MAQREIRIIFIVWLLAPLKSLVESLESHCKSLHCSLGLADVDAPVSHREAERTDEVLRVGAPVAELAEEAEVAVEDHDHRAQRVGEVEVALVVGGDAADDVELAGRAAPH